MTKEEETFVRKHYEQQGKDSGIKARYIQNIPEDAKQSYKYTIKAFYELKKL
jgi:hypothetical protein